MYLFYSIKTTLWLPIEHEIKLEDWVDIDPVALILHNRLKNNNTLGALMSTVAETPLVNFTDSAAKKVAQLIWEEGNPDLKLRVFITGGGCSGFQYGFTFDQVVNDDDIVIEKQLANADPDSEEGGSQSDGDGSSSVSLKVVTLLIDAMSFQYLKHADIDYREDLQGAQFVIRNPNAKTTCGCGQSFSS